MRGIKTVTLTIAIASGIALAQTPKGSPKSDKPASDAPPASLEQLLARALENSPDVQVAEAKVRTAEAELRRARVLLLQHVTEAHANVQACRAKVVQAERMLNRLAQMQKSGNISGEEVSRAEAELAGAKATLAAAEALLNSLAGSLPQGLKPEGTWTWKRGDGPGPGGNTEGTAPGTDLPPKRPPQASMAEKIRAALDAPVQGHEFANIPLVDVISFYRELTNQVPFVMALGGQDHVPITLKLTKEVPLGAQFQAIQDVAPGLRIFVRDYGLFFTFDNPPDDGMPYLEFWHGKEKSTGAKP